MGDKEAAAKIYKALKEDFVSNLSGGSITEINLVTLVAPTSYIFYSAIQSRLHFFSYEYNVPQFFLDFLLNVLGLLFSITIYSSQPVLLNSLFVIPAVFIYLSAPHASSRKLRKPKHRPGEDAKDDESGKSGKVDVNELLPRKPFLTTYRGGMMVITCLAILAVDFRVFPRRFAKVETWGTSLMDIGVGSFVFSSGLVSVRAQIKDAYLGKTEPLLKRFIKSLRHSFALLFMGFVRLVLTKGTDYHEHVTEYGVHWNFFFTLGLLPPFTALFQTFFSIIPSYTFWSLLLGSSYEALLQFGGAQKYVLTAERTDIISMNKEGIFSFFGYFAMFLAGQAMGMSVLPACSSKKAKSLVSRFNNSLAKPLVLHSLLWTTLYLFSTSHFYGLNLRVSRRLANLPYFFWVAAYNSWQIMAFWLVETLFFGELDAEGARDPDSENRAPKVLRSYNKNGLFVFLVANLLTGLVNKTTDTLTALTVQAMSILVAYAAVLTGLTVVLDLNGVTIRF